MKNVFLKRTVTIYCPDNHLIYDRLRLDQKGVGGGVTTRTRMAYALAARGHQVKLYINCPKNVTEMGVETHHFSDLKRDNSDLFIASTSGGKFDLSNLSGIELNNQLKILLVHGITRPNGLSSFLFDFAYAPSNFIRRKTVADWGLNGNNVFVSYRGVMEANFSSRVHQSPARNPFSLLYTGHPSKGLETAISILRFLRLADQRFHLHVFGGVGLWGETGDNPLPEPGITYHGVIGQRQLAREMQSCSFSLNLQTIQDSFGMAVIEAMRAGCIVLASSVGAFPEIVSHGQDGFLVPGDPFSEPTRQAASDLILELVHNPEYSSFLRRNAVNTPLTWDMVARTWEGHWEWAMAKDSRKVIPLTPVYGSCNECGETWLALADGLHCTRCGNYQRKSSLPVVF